MTEEITSAEPPTPSGARKLDGGEKLAVELGPLGAFLLGYFLTDRLAPAADGSLSGCSRRASRRYARRSAAASASGARPRTA